MSGESTSTQLPTNFVLAADMSSSTSNWLSVSMSNFAARVAAGPSSYTRARFSSSKVTWLSSPKSKAQAPSISRSAEYCAFGMSARKSIRLMTSSCGRSLVKPNRCWTNGTSEGSGCVGSSWPLKISAGSSAWTRIGTLSPRVNSPEKVNASTGVAPKGWKMLNNRVISLSSITPGRIDHVWSGSTLTDSIAYSSVILCRPTPTRIESMLSSSGEERSGGSAPTMPLSPPK